MLYISCHRQHQASNVATVQESNAFLMVNLFNSAIIISTSFLIFYNEEVLAFALHVLTEVCGSSHKSNKPSQFVLVKNYGLRVTETHESIDTKHTNAHKSEGGEKMR